MPNPFFNTAQFPWQLQLAQDLFDALVSACPEWKARILVQMSGLPLGEITWGVTMQQTWDEILNTASRGNKLEPLLNKVLEDSGLAAVHGLVQRVMLSGQLTGPDVCAQLVLQGELPFLNRDKLRNALRRMRGNTVRLILLVRGQPKTGKTMTLDLVTEVAKATGDEVLYLYEEIAPTVDKAVSYLFKRLGTGTAALPLIDTTVSGWQKQVGLDALDWATKTNRRWWIIVDNLGPDANGQPRMDREVLELFHQFALLMADPGFSRYFRLVLLDYPRAPNHPPSTLRKTLLEEDETSPLGDADIEAFVKSVLESRQKQYSEADLKTVIQDLGQRANVRFAQEPESGHMYALNKTLESWLSEIGP